MSTPTLRILLYFGNLSVFHEDDLCSECDRFVVFIGNIEDRKSKFTVDLFDIAQHFFAQFFLLMCEIFIKEQYFRVKYDRPSKRGFCFSESLTERIFLWRT